MSSSTADPVIHPTAVVMPGAELGPGVEIGPYSVVEPGVEVGAECHLGPHVHLLGRTTIGPGTRIASGAVLGGLPQDRDFDGSRTRVRIGAGCILHEHVTVHRATDPKGATILGDRVMMMAGSHVGHDAHVEDDVVLVNGASVAGHAHVGAGAMLVAHSAVHQFGRIGRLTLVGGSAMVTRDAPPFSIVTGSYPVLWRGPNTVGLQRAGFSSDERSAIRKALQSLFCHPEGSKAAAQAPAEHDLASVREISVFVLASERGICGRKEKS